MHTGGWLLYPAARIAHETASAAAPVHERRKPASNMTFSLRHVMSLCPCCCALLATHDML